MEGILIGRYPGDSYAGGNPWQLLTAVLGKLVETSGCASSIIIVGNRHWTQRERGQWAVNYTRSTRNLIRWLITLGVQTF